MGANLGLKLKYLGGLFILMKKKSWAAQKMFARAEKESKTSKLNWTGLNYQWKRNNNNNISCNNNNSHEVVLAFTR
jgi:hypothetical protein